MTQIKGMTNRETLKSFETKHNKSIEWVIILNHNHFNEGQVRKHASTIIIIIK